MALLKGQRIQIGKGKKVGKTSREPQKFPLSGVPHFWEKLNFWIGVVAVAVLGLVYFVIQVLISYWTFTSLSFQDYKNVVNEYQNQRYGKLEDRVHQLEIRLTPTPTSVPVIK